MCVSKYVCVFICILVCIQCVCVSVCLSVYVQYVCMCVCTVCMYICVCMYVYACMHVSMYVCLSVCLSVCMYGGVPGSPRLCWRLTMPPRVQRRSSLLRWALRRLVTDQGSTNRERGTQREVAGVSQQIKRGERIC